MANTNIILYYEALKAKNWNNFEELFNTHPLDEKSIQKLYTYSCTNNHLEVVSYLLTNSQFKAISFGLNGFHTAAHYGYWNIVEFFIFDYKIAKSLAVEEMIIESRADVKEKLEQYFQTRELQQNLNDILVNKENKRNVKI